MNFSIKTKDLKIGLSRIISVSDKKNTTTQPHECYFKVNSGEIELMSTDNEIFAKVTLEGKSNDNFNFCTNSKNLFDIVKELNEETISFNFNDVENSLNLSTSKSFYELLTYHNDHFNFCSFPKTNNSIKLSRFSLLQMLSLTSYAVSNDETRIYLNGLFLQEVNNSLRMVATDGHRLSMLEKEFDGETNDFLVNGVILPKKRNSRA